jgi:carbonic anhydrase
VRRHKGCVRKHGEHGLIDNWLRHIKDVGRFHAEKLNGLKHDDKLNLLCELNVMEQVI